MIKYITFFIPLTNINMSQCPVKFFKFEMSSFLILEFLTDEKKKKKCSVSKHLISLFPPFLSRLSKNYIYLPYPLAVPYLKLLL